MDETTREVVAARAGRACEYCWIREQDDAYSFHLEHVIAIKHGGTTTLDNLAYACQHCNLHKGPNLSGVDPQSGEVVTLYHPRRDTWALHFAMVEFHIVGLTLAGRATVRVLAMNDSDRVQLRQLAGSGRQS
ncbi:MAG TPA: HNH endonuclease signature motif containing protein [Lacipirellulaceae bacterium]|nr:HNH endonuclease signature motif containing protein [Lacipirellulaceae bacterium]